MCGIAGIYGTPVKEELFKIMDVQRHRGLDGRNFWVSPEKNIMLGHDRLAIIDVEGGTQPLLNEDGTMACVVNGEIYNYYDLKQPLYKTHTFASQSDSEIVLHLLEEEGPNFISKLDGMFAFAIWSEKWGLILGRDPLGKKPLYFGFDEQNNLCFSSEIKPLLPVSKKIQSLPPGSIWVISPNSSPDVTMIQRYYSFPKPKVEIKNMADALKHLDGLLNDAVKKRLMADVPVGAFLSGGLDSSLIVAIMKRHVTTNLHTFSVGLEGSADINNARKVASILGTIHHERIITEDLLYKTLPKVIRSLESYDPALIRSSVATYLVSELASNYVKVVLSGEGADELFAGYQYLAEYSSYDTLSEELLYITKTLHNTNLQRGDRMTMIHGLEARMPFFDKKLLDFAFKLDSRLLVSSIGQNLSKLKPDWQGKILLRKVAEKYLPPDIVWRKKEKFAIGSGVASILEHYAEKRISDAEFNAHKCHCPVRSSGFFSKEMYYYWNLFPLNMKRSDVLNLIGQSRSLNPTQRYA